MKTNSWTTAGQAKDISSSPNTLLKVLRRGRHWVWGPKRRRAIKEWSIAINNDWFDNLNPPVVCSTDRSKAVVSVLVLLLVALWFIQRGDLLYVFPCVILFLCFSVLLVLRLPRLGKRELIFVLFVRLFGLGLFRFVGFLFLLGSGKGCGLWLWHSLDFSLTLFRKAFSFFFSRTQCLGRNIYIVSLKTLLQQGISQPEIYGDLVYRFRKIVGKSNFSEQFGKFINRGKELAISWMLCGRLHA